MYRKQLLHVPQAPRLWEEALDPTELDFINNDEETIPDTNILSMNRRVLRTIIRENLNPLERRVIDAFMSGYTHGVIGVTEKHWRYHLGTALRTMRKKLVDKGAKKGVKYDFKQEDL